MSFDKAWSDPFGDVQPFSSGASTTNLSINSPPPLFQDEDSANAAAFSASVVIPLSPPSSPPVVRSADVEVDLDSLASTASASHSIAMSIPPPPDLDDEKIVSPNPFAESPPAGSPLDDYNVPISPATTAVLPSIVLPLASHAAEASLDVRSHSHPCSVSVALRPLALPAESTDLLPVPYYMLLVIRFFGTLT